MAIEGTYSREVMSLPEEPFESERLRLQPMTAGDESALWRMLSSEEVLRFIPLDPAMDRAESRQKSLAEFEEGIRYKFFFAVFWKNPEGDQSEEMIGLEILRPFEDGSAMEIGYWFQEEVWGMGLATEATIAVADHCPDKMNFPKEDIAAIVQVGNHPSKRVLEKTGLEVLQTEQEGDQDIWYLEMKA